MVKVSNCMYPITKSCNWIPPKIARQLREERREDTQSQSKLLLQIQLTAKSNNGRKYTSIYPGDESRKLHCWAVFPLCSGYLYKKFPDLHCPCRIRLEAERSSIQCQHKDALYRSRISTPRHVLRHYTGMMHPLVWKSWEPDLHNWGFLPHKSGLLFAPPRRQCSEFVRNHSWRLVSSPPPLAPNGVTESDQVLNGLIRIIK